MDTYPPYSNAALFNVRLTDLRGEVYEALLALYHACGPEMDGKPEMAGALSVLQKVSGRKSP